MNECTGPPLGVSAMEAAATEGGHLEVLAWLHAQGCPWDERPCCAAAARNNVRLLEWLRAHGCPWGVETCAAAARAGGSRAGEAGIGRVRWHETPVRPPTGVPGPFSPNTSDKGELTTAVLSLERGEGRPVNSLSGGSVAIALPRIRAGKSSPGPTIKIVALRINKSFFYNPLSPTSTASIRIRYARGSL